MTWAVPQRYPPGYPAVTQGSTRGLTPKSAIARRENQTQKRKPRPTRAKPYPTPVCLAGRAAGQIWAKCQEFSIRLPICQDLPNFERIDCDNKQLGDVQSSGPRTYR